MRGKKACGLALCVGLAAAALTWRGDAQPGEPQPGGAPKGGGEAALPIRQVVLFNSGVGYLQREGEVVGETNVDLTFAAGDVDDLLKSLVLQDLGGGVVTGVRYDSHDPASRVLRSFSLDLSENPTFAEILNQARGEKVELTLTEPGAAPRKMQAAIVGMEARANAVYPEPPRGDGEGAAEMTRRGASPESLNVTGPSGLQSIPMQRVLGVRFLNPTLEAEFQQALRVLAGANDMQKRRVSIGFSGEGKRAVRVGYVLERPIWKTTYRLRLEPGKKAFLQGWAHVDNTSDDDWTDVRLALVSGKPIAFRMNLQEPLYVPRPTVEMHSMLRQSAGGFGLSFAPGSQLGGAAGTFNGGTFTGGFNGRGPSVNQYAVAAFDAINPFSADANRLTFEQLQKRREEAKKAAAQAKDAGPEIAMNFREGIQSVATGEAVGDYYQFVIDRKVTLPRQKSAMLPILDREVDSEKVSVFSDAVHARHPLLGLRLKNASGKPLPEGPIVVHEAGRWAGDSRIGDWAANETRLIAYALDHACEVKKTVASAPGPKMALRLDEAKLASRYLQRDTATYEIRNRAGQERRLVVEHPIRAGWTLTGAGPAERTRNAYRFELTVAAGETKTLTVVEEEARVDECPSGPSTVAIAKTGITVKAIAHQAPEETLAIQATNGSLVFTMRNRETKSYLVQNLSDEDREFSVDHVVKKDWRVVGMEKPAEGPNVVRFVLSAKAGASAKRDVESEKVYRTTTLPLAGHSDERLRELARLPAASAEMRKGFAKLIGLRAAVVETKGQFAQAEAKLTAMSVNQARLRENLRIVPADSDAHQRILDRFLAQETEFDAAQARASQAQSAVEAAARALAEFHTGWSAE